MDREMININANLIDDVKIARLDNTDTDVANFTLVKKYGKSKEYINCSLYGDKVKFTEDFIKGDLIHVFGYFKEVTKGDRVFKNFIVKHINKIEENEREDV